MKNQLKQLSPVLEGFKVRIDDKGRVLSEPSPYLQMTDGMAPEYRRLLDQYNQAKEVIRMPKATGFIRDAWKITENEEDAGTFNTEQLRGIHIYSAICEYPPQLGHYIPCDEEGKPLEKPSGYDDVFTKGGDFMGYSIEWKLACSDFRKAQSKVLFEGWEVTINNHGDVLIENYKGRGIRFNEDENIYFISSGNRIQMYNYEDAFIACPHYVDLTKLK